MAQSQTTQHGSQPNPLERLCLLSLDGGGVRGLSTLYILKGLMTQLNNERRKYDLPAVKPCEVFDLIGGTSTGGLIAIMLGRLEMDVDECITAYTELMKAVFAKSRWSPLDWRGRMKPRFSSEKLKQAVENVIKSKGASPSDAFNDGIDRGCRTFVCATAKETSGVARLRSYTLPDANTIPATICQAALATSAATSFFDPVSIGARQFVDGALGANNPVDEVEGEATNIWSSGNGDLKPLVKCFVTIGTGNPGKKALEDNMLGFLSKNLVAIATETEETERKFVARWAKHLDEKRFFRFNVEQGLQDVGLAEHKEQGRMEVVTDEYLEHQAQKFRVRDCVQNLRQKQRDCILQKSRVAKTTHYIPFAKNQYFVGRKDELIDLKRKLIDDRECQGMSIVGLGGTGKTQVALEFAYMVKEMKPEFAVFWLPVVSMASFDQACTELVRALHIQQADEDEDAKEVFKRYLSDVNLGQRWLLVLDNADDQDTMFGTADSKGIVEYLPQSEHGVTVYTTRVQEIAVSLTRAEVMELGPMEQKDAEEFFKKSLIRKNLLDDEMARAKLLDELTCLPLAITQATAYLNNNKASSIAKYLRLLQNTEQDLVSLMSKEFQDSTRYAGSANAVATTWMVSFNQIRERDAVAADLLAFMSCIEWKAIPRSLLPSVQSEERMEAAIGILCGYSFLTLRENESQEEGGEEWYDMHRLVHLAIRIWTNKHSDVADTAEKALKHVTRVFPSRKWEDRALWRAYMPHALRLLQTAQSGNLEVKSALTYRMGSCFHRDGKIREAITWLEICYQWRINNLDEDNIDRLNAEHALADAYLANGQFKKAIEFLEHVVTIQQRLERHINLQTSQHALASAYLEEGQIKKAIELLEHVVKVRKVLVEEHLDRLASQHQLASAYLKDGQIKKAIELLEHVVEVRKVLVEEHPDRIASQHQLASAYLKDGQVKKAIELLEQVVEVQKVLAEEHPDRLASQHTLAGAYLEDSQVKKAVELFKYVVAVREKVLAEEHPSRLASQHELARAYLKDSQIKKAIELLKQVVEVQKVLAEEHLDRLASQHELARAYLEDRQVKKAVELFKHVVAIQEKVLAEEHPDRLSSQHTLAGAYLEDSQVKKAVELFEYVVAVREKVLAEEHPSRLASQHELARAYWADGQVHEAIKLLEQVVIIKARVLRDDHPGRLVSERVLKEMRAQLSQDPDLET